MVIANAATAITSISSAAKIGKNVAKRGAIQKHNRHIESIKVGKLKCLKLERILHTPLKLGVEVASLV